MNGERIKKGKVLGTVIMFFVVIVFLLPIYIVVTNSFKTNNQYWRSMISLPTGFNIKESYIAAIQQINYLKLTLNSLYVFVFSLAGMVVLGSMTAYKICRVQGKLSNFIYFLFLSCMIIPFQGMMIPLIKILASTHLINSLSGLGITYWVFMTPVVIFMYHGFIKTIPYEIEESARIDGANGVTMFFRIIFPLMTPMTLTVVALFGLGIWNDFLTPLLLLQKSQLYTLPLGVTIFYGTASQKPDQYPAIYAALIISSVPLLLFFFFMQKYIVSGITAGAVKG